MKKVITIFRNFWKFSQKQWHTFWNFLKINLVLLELCENLDHLPKYIKILTKIPKFLEKYLNSPVNLTISSEIQKLRWKTWIFTGKWKNFLGHSEALLMFLNSDKCLIFWNFKNSVKSRKIIFEILIFRQKSWNFIRNFESPVFFT